MCGIAGFSGTFDPALLDRMTNSLRHRGPDDSGTLHLPNHGIGLGHRRLSIIDLSAAGKQPMWDSTERCVISYNGELYNYRELRKELETGYIFRTSSDTEVLLALYNKEGPDMLARLNGMFAFALWDTHNEHLLIARDAIGVKPLYFSVLDAGVLFASEIKALLQYDALSRDLNYSALRDYLTYLWCPAPHTPLKAVQKLSTGSAMLVAKGRIQRKWCFYQFPYGPKTSFDSVDQAAKQLRTHLRTSVERQLVADVEVGAFLSGGLDSSSVVAMARQINPDKEIQCFTIGFKNASSEFSSEMGNDLPYATQVAEHLRTPLHRIDVGPDIVDDLEMMIYYLDEPQADVAPLFVHKICKLAREQGIKVLLSGAGGDDILGGYRRHRALDLERYWSGLPRALRSVLQKSARSVSVSRQSARYFAKAFQYAALPPRQRLISYFWWCRPQIIESLFHPDIRREIAARDVSRPFEQALARLPAETSRLDQMLFLDGSFFLPDHNLNYTDKLSMATGVETRVPLLDPDLVRFATQLPDDMKQRGSVGKWLFKKSMEPHLPKSVIYRPKVGFGGPVRYWLANQLRPLLNDTLNPTALAQDSIFDARAVQKLIADDRQGKIDASYIILSLLCFHLWYRSFGTHAALANSELRFA